MIPDGPAGPDALDAVLRRLGPLADAVGLVTRPAGAGWESWDEVASADGVATWLGDVRRGDPAGERPRSVAASFLIGWAASAVLAPGVAVVGACGRCPTLDRECLRVRRARGGWIEGVHIRQGGLSGPEVSAPRAFGARAHTVLSPLVDALAAASPLGRRTLWGAVIDAAHVVAVAAQDAGTDYPGALALWEVAGEVADVIGEAAGLAAHVRPRPFTTGGRAAPRLCCRRATCCLAYRAPSSAERRARGEETRCAGCPLMLP